MPDWLNVELIVAILAVVAALLQTLGKGKYIAIVEAIIKAVEDDGSHLLKRRIAVETKKVGLAETLDKKVQKITEGGGK